MLVIKIKIGRAAAKDHFVGSPRLAGSKFSNQRPGMTGMISGNRE